MNHRILAILSSMIFLSACNKLKLDGMFDLGMTAEVPVANGGIQSSTPVAGYKVQPLSFVFSVPGATTASAPLIFHLDIASGTVTTVNFTGPSYTLSAEKMAALHALLATSIISNLYEASGEGILCDPPANWASIAPSWYSVLTTDHGSFYLGGGCGGTDLYLPGNNNLWGDSSSNSLYQFLLDASNDAQSLTVSSQSASLNWLTYVQLQPLGI